MLKVTLDDAKSFVSKSQTLKPYQVSLDSYLDKDWSNIQSSGKEYRLYNLLQALDSIKKSRDGLDTLIECVTTGKSSEWGIVENYCYDYYIINDLLLI